MLNALHLHKHFGQLHVLKDVSLNVKQGQVIAIIGPSGSGKSTFLRCLNHLETIDHGHIEIAGQVLASTDEHGKTHYPSDKKARMICRQTGMVFQHFNLFPHMTVLQNLIEAPIIVRKMKRPEAMALAEPLLAKVGLADKADNYPDQLSGGQKQRVAIARALAMEPDILLFDEPTSALDPELTGEVLRTMRQLAEDQMTMLIVTHEMAFAREVAHRVVFMDQGEIVEDRTASDFFSHPSSERAHKFLANML